MIRHWDLEGTGGRPERALAESTELKEARGRRPEAARFVEGRQLFVMVDVEDRAAVMARGLGSAAHELGADPTMADVGMHARVEQEGVIAAIPGDVHEANQFVARERANPCEAVREHGLPIAGVGRLLPRRPAAGGRTVTEERVELEVGERRPDAVVDAWRGRRLVGHGGQL